MTHEAATVLSQTVALILFVALFVGVIVYVFWPGNKKKFDEAAQAAARDDEKNDKPRRRPVMSHKEIDQVTGVETTGHVWDGDLKELNKPLPRWWLYTFYACIVWAIGYWVVYPAWPTLYGYTKGVFGYSQRGEVDKEVAAAKAEQAKYLASDRRHAARRHREEPGADAVRDGGRRGGVRRQLRPCHGKGAQGGVGYPNLNDDDWLWGGTPEADPADDHARHPLRRSRGAPDGDAALRPRRHPAARPDQGRGAVRALAVGPRHRRGRGRARQARSSPRTASPATARTARATRSSARPNLTDGIWLYGGKAGRHREDDRDRPRRRDAVLGGRLDPVTIKMLAAYVHSLGGGK